MATRPEPSAVQGDAVETTAELRDGRWLVVRPRLEELLLETDRSLVVVSAPAGTGKTILARRWRDVGAAAGRPVALVRCVPGYDDGDALLRDARSAVVGALGRGGGGPDSGATATVRRHGQLGAVHDLAALAEGGAGGVWLVLDDVHLVRGRSGRAALARLVEAAGPHLRLVLVTRRHVGLGLEGVRARGELVELRADALAFRPSETAALLQQAGLWMAPTEVARLTYRTEGWAIALRIVATALAGTSDPSAFVDGFDGSDHAVADYLLGEVLLGAPDDVRAFLLATSVCDQLPVDLAAALTGRRDAAQVLDGLERDGLLVSHLGRTRAAYRYHELLRTFCLAELRRIVPGEERRLHLAAGRWWLEQGEPLHALEHQLLAGDVAEVAATLRQHAMRLLLAGRALPLLEAIERHGSERRDPVVAWVAAASALQLGRRAAVVRWRAVAEGSRGAGGSSDGPWLQVIATTVAALGDLDDPERRTAALDRLLELEADEHDLDAGSWVAAVRAHALLEAGQLQAAREAFTRLTWRERGRDGGAAVLVAHAGLARLALLVNDIEEAALAADAGASVAIGAGLTNTPAAAVCALAASWCAYLRADQPGMARALRAAQPAIAAVGDQRLTAAARTLQLLLELDDGADGYASACALRRMLDRDLVGHDGFADAWLAPLLTWHASSLGERALARSFADRYVASPTAAAGEAALVAAQLASAGGHGAEVVRLLRDVVDDPGAWQVGTNRVSALLVLTSANVRRGHPSKAMERFVQALELAAPDRLVRPFLQQRQVTEQLTAAGVGRFGRLQAFLSEITARLQGGPSATPALVQLTERELDVLRELPSLLTLGDIAEVQGVSLNTVKTHARAVYRKLGVTSRRAAVTTARDQGLLPPG